MQVITHETVSHPKSLEKLLNAIVIELTALRTLANEIKTDMSAHTHGGVTTGAGNTGAAATISAADAVQKIKKSK